MKNEYITLQTLIEGIIEKELPAFWYQISIGKNALGGGYYFAIKIAAKDYLINGVNGQRPQAVSLNLELDSMELTTQIYGGCGGDRIYRQPNRSDIKEKYLAMKGVKIPFRKPQPTREAVLKAIKMFCIRYKAALADNYSQLCYHEIVNYDKLLNPSVSIKEFIDQYRLQASDLWGDAMGAWFDVASHIHSRKLPIPTQWQYRPAKKGNDIDKESLFYPMFKSASNELLQAIGAFLFRYCRLLQHLGKSY